MSKILRQNVGGVDFTMVGCALTGVCPTAAADYVKQITLSDGDVIEDGMMMVVTFANGNSAGNAPSTKTIYSSDQVDYFEDDQLTIPFTLAPEGCYEIEYTGTANAYTYTDYPVFQVGSVSGPVCDYRGHIASGDLWNAGDSVQCMLKEGKFLLLGGSGGADIDVYDSMAELIADLPNLQEGQFAATKDTGDELAQPVDVVEEDNLHAVSSNAVAELLDWKYKVVPCLGGNSGNIAIPESYDGNYEYSVYDYKYHIEYHGIHFKEEGNINLGCIATNYASLSNDYIGLRNNAIAYVRESTAGDFRIAYRPLSNHTAI